MEQGWDPEVKHFFKKVMNSIFFGLFWMMTFVGVGLYAGFADSDNKPLWAVVIFYVIMMTALFFLMRYYWRTWNGRR